MNLTLKGYKYKLIIYFGILLIIYYLTESNIFPIQNQTFSEKSRGIETYPKFIFNGILGQFFNFKWIGNIIFLLPLFFFSDLKKLAKENVIFFSTILLSFTIIAVKGYFGWRYMFTLMPLFLIFFSAKISEYLTILKSDENKQIRIFLFVIGLSVLNYYILNSFGDYLFVKRYFVFTILFFTLTSVYALINSANNMLLLSGIILSLSLFFRHDFNTNQYFWTVMFFMSTYTFLTIEIIRNSDKIVLKINHYFGLKYADVLVKGTSFFMLLILFYLYNKRSFLVLTTSDPFIIVLVIAIYFKYLNPRFQKILLIPIFIYYIFFNYHTSQIGNTDFQSKGIVKSSQLYFDALVSPFLNNSSSKIMVNYIENNIRQDETILLNNLPAFYYYSNHRYLYYWCQEDHAFNQMGQLEIFESKKLADVYFDLKSKLHVKYILTSKYKNQFCQVPLEDFLNDYCIKVFVHDDYELYQLK
jgi:hypothetical protein